MNSKRFAHPIQDVAAAPSHIPLNNWTAGPGDHNHNDPTGAAAVKDLRERRETFGLKKYQLDIPPHLTVHDDQGDSRQNLGAEDIDSKLNPPDSEATVENTTKNSTLSPDLQRPTNSTPRQLPPQADHSAPQAQSSTARSGNFSLQQKDRILSPIIASSHRLLTAVHKISAMPSDSPLLAPPSPTSEFADYLPRVTKDLDDVTTHAAGLPGKSDLSFHRTLDRKLAKELDEASDRILKLTGDLLELLDTGKNGKKRRWLEDEEDVKHGYKRGVVEVVDALLEDAVSTRVALYAAS